MKKIHNREKGTGTIEKKRNRFYLKLRIGDKCKSTLLLGKDDKPVTNRKDAEAAAALLRPVLRAQQKEEIALHVAEARKLKRQSNITVPQIWDTYLKSMRPDSGETTLKCYFTALQGFIQWLNKEYPAVEKVNSITEDMAMEFFNTIWDTHISARTYNSYRQALRLIFRCIAEPCGMDSSPFDRIVPKKGVSESRKEFTEEQIKAIFAGFETGFFYDTEAENSGGASKRRQYKPMNEDEMYVLLNLCCWTGCRGQDGCLMQWSNVDMERRQISYVPRKTARKTNHRAVTLPMHPQLTEALQRAVAWRSRNRTGEDYILPAVAKRYLYNSSGVQKDVMKIIRCATGLKTTADANKTTGRRKLAANAYSLHSFRHTFVSFCANAGVPLAIVSEIVGHGSLEMTRHYTHVSSEAKNKAVEALPKLNPVVENCDPLPEKKHLLAQLASLPTHQLAQLLQQQKITYLLDVE